MSLREWWDRFLAKVSGPEAPEEADRIRLRPDNPTNKPFHQTPGLGPTALPPEEPKP